MQINALEESPASISGLCSLTGSEFMRLAPTEQASAVARLSVFARVEPSHKSNLVTRLKEQVGSAVQPSATPGLEKLALTTCIFRNRVHPVLHLVCAVC